MENAIFKPGDQLGSFVIQEREEDFKPLQRYRAKHAQNHTNALICVRDLRHAPPSPEAALAFKMRAEPLFALRIDTIPDLLEVDIQNGFQWAAFAFPEGTPLHDFIAEHGPLSPMAGALLLRAIGASLHEARSAGAHGLLQTNAIYVDAEGSLRYLLHFGIASLFEIGPEALLHCPPELSKMSSYPGETADIYSAAAIVWEAIAGNEPGATSEPDPGRNERLKQRFPNLRSVRPEVPEGLSRLLFEWTSRDEFERPPYWALALIELEAELGALLRVAHIPKTAEDLASEDSEAPTLPSSMSIQVRAKPLSAAQVLPSADSLEHAQTIPAPAPLSAIFANTAELPTPRTAEPTRRETPPATQAPAPMEPASKGEMKPSRATRKAREIAAFAMGALCLGAAAMLALFSFRASEPAPPSEAPAAQPAQIQAAQTSAQIPKVHEQIMQDHNSDDPKGEPTIPKGRPRPRNEAKKRESPIDRFEPAGHLKARIYSGSH